ncbi:MAG: hypothetical protein ACJ8GJ_17665, partial [Vitreoscilla sp.]
ASTPTPVPRPAPAAADGPKKSLLVPIAGAAVVVLAVGGWFALRPAPGADNAPPAAANAASAPAAPAPAPAPMQAPAPVPAPAASPVEASAATSASPASQRSALEEAMRRADLEAQGQAKARTEAETKARADAQAAKAKADGDAGAQVAAASQPSRTEPGSDAAELFRQGYAAYLAGRVPEGIRQMERADAMGATGARARLCAIYRKPTAAEGKDFLKEANKCKDID